ncbi:hypothetical protein [Bradyrhizobium sp. 2TAF24]|uniref:hypothetical protein n=1 Tax=Bradyrhizobium sp. 2TAF24 TaxID=3233011 RepID=UPI003F8F5890
MLTAIPALMLATAAMAAPQGGGFASRAPETITQVRLVCDQFCNCWSTKYQERRQRERPEELSGPRCPRGGHLNYYYQAGAPTETNFFDNFFGLIPPGPSYRSW